MGFASWQRYCTASSSGRQPNFAALNRGRHLCSAGRPSRWALAHILVLFCNIDDVICVYTTVSSWLTLRTASPVRVNMAALEFLDKLILLLLPQYMAVEPTQIHRGTSNGKDCQRSLSQVHSRPIHSWRLWMSGDQTAPAR